MTVLATIFFQQTNQRGRCMLIRAGMKERKLGNGAKQVLELYGFLVMSHEILLGKGQQ